MIDNNFHISNEWQIKLTMNDNFMSSQDNDDKQLIYSKIDHIEIVIGDETDRIINDLFQSRLSRY